MKERMFRFYRFNINNEYIHHSLRLFGITCWTMYYCAGFGWFRLFGHGLDWKDLTRYELTFSQRIHKTKWLKVGKWCISRLMIFKI
jgi:hypothetical protein